VNRRTRVSWRPEPSRQKLAKEGVDFVRRYDDRLTEGAVSAIAATALRPIVGLRRCMLRREFGVTPYCVNYQAYRIGDDLWLVELDVMTAFLRNNQLTVMGKIRKLHLLLPLFLIDSLPIIG